ncbi:FBD-associated F-box protein At4g10400-like [Bidens hawaiensis]|uniref:FBD-associated F-box protein At4g10400-like n=1 Tax=Bidens hawaiensis TaxID=980011 RepID=UPI004049486F
MRLLSYFLNPDFPKSDFKLFGLFSRKQTASSKNADLISSLPEELQSHILSLMPTKYAVQTIILSKRWRYTWMHITKLDFDDIPHNIGSGNVAQSVDGVLASCKTSQLEFFRLNISSNRVQKSSVSNWIDKAVRLNIRELDIQVKFLELPSSLFTCRTLTKLRLDPESPIRTVWECPSVVSLPCLKTLDIVVYTNPLVYAFKLILACPILENLSLKVVWHSGVEDYVFNIPTLKRLKLTLLDSSRTNKVVLRVPNLEHLSFDGILRSLFVMENVPALVEGSFSFYKRSFNNLSFELLKGISGVKSLFLQKIRETQSEDSSLHKILFASPLPVFLNMKHLELKGLWHFGLILNFLESSPELEEIYIEKLQGSHWIAPKSVPACMLAKLTTIKLLNFMGRKCDMPFVKFLLGNANVLKRVTINLEKSSIEEESRFCSHLLNLPRASRSCEIHFHRN